MSKFRRTRTQSPKRSAPRPEVQRHNHPPTPPVPQTTTDPPTPEVARINAISLIARTTWFGLLAYLAFVGVTLLGVEDADFFVPSRQTQLPLVNVAIPTSAFFWFAPLLGAGLYAYLHLQLLKLWEALATPLPQIDGKHLSDVIYPWLISDFALSRRKDGALRARPIAWLSHSATWVLAWAAGPFVLTLFWLRSMPAHDPWLTGINAVCVLISLYVAFSSYWSLHARCLQPEDNPNVWEPPGRQYLCVIVLYTIAGATWAGAIGIKDLPESVSSYSPYPANLRGVELVAKPADWRDYQTARTRFRATWCRRKGLEREICGDLYSAANPEPQYVKRLRTDWCETEPRSIDDCPAHFTALDETFSAEWDEEWRRKIDALEPLDLRGKDLRNADMAVAFLAGADFRGARMGGANLGSARVSGARFRNSELRGATLWRIRAERANFWQAQLDNATLNRGRFDGATFAEASITNAEFRQTIAERANFNEADLSDSKLHGVFAESASFRGAKLEGTRVSRSNLEGADFTEAVLKRVNFRNTILNGATFSEANLQGADLASVHLRHVDISGGNLSQARLYKAVFENVKLLGAVFDGADLRETQFIDTRLNGVNLIGVQLGGANLSEADLARASLNNAILIQVDLKNAFLPEANLRKSVLVAANLEGAHLRDSRLNGTDFWGANLKGADLTDARMRGAVLNFANLQSTELSPRSLRRSSIRGADLRFSAVTQEMVNNAFGDSLTKLPANLIMPDHWDDRATTRDEWPVRLLIMRDRLHDRLKIADDDYEIENGFIYNFLLDEDMLPYDLIGTTSRTKRRKERSHPDASFYAWLDAGAPPGKPRWGLIEPVP